MKNIQKFLCIIYVFFIVYSSTYAAITDDYSSRTYKIIGLMQVKNEEDIIEQSLRALACYTDSIVVLDDASTDGTIAIVEKLAAELSIEVIIKNNKSQWIYGSELTNKQKLLDKGRELGGTHFIALDADEIIVATALKNSALKNNILSLQKGQILQLPLLNLWKSCDYYRSTFNDIYPNVVYCSCIFCDDGISDMASCLDHSYSGFLDIGRFPTKTIALPSQNLYVYLSDLDCAIMHFPFVNWNNVLIKRVWIMMLEVIRLSEKIFNKRMFEIRTIEDINHFYVVHQSLSVENIVVSNVNPEWKAYSFFDETVFTYRKLQGRIDDIKKWVERYGLEYFKDLTDIYQYIEPILKNEIV